MPQEQSGGSSWAPHSISRPRGSRCIPTTATWRQEGKIFDKHHSCSSSSACSSAAHSRGTRPTEAVWRTGFKLLLLEPSLGLSERPAAWVMKWARDTAPVDVFHARSFEEASGRLVYATSSLELLWPFFTPLCAFTSSSLLDAVRAVLACVAFFLGFKSAVTTREEEWEPRVDAQAWDARTGVAGWLPVIATLETLAMLLALRAFFPLVQNKVRTPVSVVPSYTHNRGNGALLNEPMTSKLPLSAHFMEFTEQLCHSGVRPGVRWAPREANREADRLPNDDPRSPVAQTQKKRFREETGCRQQDRAKQRGPGDKLRAKNRDEEQHCEECGTAINSASRRDGSSWCRLWVVRRVLVFLLLAFMLPLRFLSRFLFYARIFFFFPSLPSSVAVAFRSQLQYWTSRHIRGSPQPLTCLRPTPSG